MCHELGCFTCICSFKLPISLPSKLTVELPSCYRRRNSIMWHAQGHTVTGAGQLPFCQTDEESKFCLSHFLNFYNEQSYILWSGKGHIFYLSLSRIQISCLAKIVKSIILLCDSVPGTITYKVPLVWLYDSLLGMNYPMRSSSQLWARLQKNVILVYLIFDSSLHFHILSNFINMSWITKLIAIKCVEKKQPYFKQDEILLSVNILN